MKKSIFTTLIMAAFAVTGQTTTVSADSMKGLMVQPRAATTKLVGEDTGKLMGTIIHSRSGYGFNSDGTLITAAFMYPDGTIVPLGQTGTNALHGRVLSGAIPAAIGAYGAIEAAKEIRPDITNISNNVTAKGGAGGKGGSASANAMALAANLSLSLADKHHKKSRR